MPRSLRAASAVLLLAALAALGGCVDDEIRAADLGWSRPADGQLWCDVLTDDQVERLGGSGTSGPWQSPQDPTYDDGRGCTVTPDLEGRDGVGESSPDLANLQARLVPPRTRAALEAGNHSPVDEGLEGELLARGGGLHTAEPLGLFVLRRACPRPDTPGRPDDLELRMFLVPDRLGVAEAVDVLRRAWALAADDVGCRGRG